MPNKEHYQLLIEGVGAWNDWRRKSNTAPQLESAVLTGLNLTGANLSRADLSRATLSHTKLERADLRNSSFQNAEITYTDLSYSDLGNTYLVGTAFDDTDFFHTKLTNANLSGAVFKNANFAFTNFKGALFNETSLLNSDLSTASGLDEAKHIAATSIGIDTLYRSKGSVSQNFLRNCGIPSQFLEHSRTIFSVDRAIEFYSCFISYSHKDEEFAQKLFSRLREKDLRVWFAPEEMMGGNKLWDQIDRAIRFHDKLLIVLSDASILSDWVMTEIRRARKRELAERRHILFPVRLTDISTLKEWACFDADSGRDLAKEVREYFIPDFSNWKNCDHFEKAFDRLVRDLKKSQTFPSK